MTQFQFGDSVKSRNKKGFVLHHSSNVYVAWEDGSQSTIDPAKLELVPHPDTVRLDFIQNSSAEIQFYHTSDEYDDDYDTEWFSLSTPRCDLRETIDETMQEQAP